MRSEGGGDTTLDRRGNGQVLASSEVDAVSGTGLVVSILIFAAAIAVVFSAAALVFYRRAAARLMLTRSRPDNAVPSPLPDRSHRTGSISDYLICFGSGAAPPEALETARARQRRLALVYSGAGVCCCLMLAVAYVVGLGSVSWRGALRGFAYCTWPVILTLHILLGWTWYIRRRNEVIYACVLLLLGCISRLYSPKFSFMSMVEVFLFINGPTTVLVLAFANRRLRAIGPTVLALSHRVSCRSGHAGHYFGHQSSIQLLGKRCRRLCRAGSWKSRGYYPWPAYYAAIRVVGCALDHASIPRAAYQ